MCTYTYVYSYHLFLNDGSIIVPCTGVNGGMNQVKSRAVFVLLDDTHFTCVHLHSL